MNYVVMDTVTERLYSPRGYYGPKRFALRYAKARATRLNKESGTTNWVVLTRSEFDDKFNPMVAVYNHITGDGKTPIYIRKSDVGTCVDPSTERYHSM